MKDFFPIIDEASHEASRSLSAMVGAYLTLAVVAALVYFQFLPLPRVPILWSFLVFAIFIAFTTYSVKRWGVRSRVYRVMNHLESLSLLTGFAVSMQVSTVEFPLVWAFYLIMSLMHAQVTGANVGGLLVVGSPLAMLGLSGAGEFTEHEWHALVAGATLAVVIYWFYGTTRERQLLALKKQLEVEERLTRTELELFGERQLRKVETQWLDTLQMTAATIFLVDENTQVVSVGGAASDTDLSFWQSLLDSVNLDLDTVQVGQPLTIFGLRTEQGKYVDLRVVPLPKGAMPGCCAVLVQEVTERVLLEEEHKRMSEQMVVAEKMASLGVLSAGIAHEINNPLTYISGNLEYLIDNGFSDAGSESVLEDIREGMAQIRRIVGELKLFAHSGAGNTAAFFDLREVCWRTERMLGAEFKRAAIFTISLPDEPVSTFGRPERLQQVLMNLLVNAVQALPDRERSENRIALSLQVDGDEAVLIVEDNGVGIPDELQRKIFEPFYTTKAPGEGTGMGLSISYQIVQEHRGRMEGRSTKEGGTQFFIRLPIIHEQTPDQGSSLI